MLDAQTLDEHHPKGSKGIGKVFANGKITSIVKKRKSDDEKEEDLFDESNETVAVTVKQTIKKYHRRSPATIVKVPPSNATINDVNARRERMPTP